MEIRYGTGSPAEVPVKPGDIIPVRIDFPYKGRPQDCKVQFRLSTGTQYVTGETAVKNIDTEKGPFPIVDGSMNFEVRTIDDEGIPVKIPTTGFAAGVYNLSCVVRTLTDTTSEIGVAWAALRLGVA